MSVEARESTFAIGIIFPIITLGLIVLRFHTRLHRKDSLRTDDWLCVPAWLCLAGCCTCLLVGNVRNAFRDPLNGDPEHSSPSQQLFAHLAFFVVKFYFVGSMFIKLSIIYLYRRIFVGYWITMINIGLTVFTSIWGVYAFISSIVYCGSNVHDNWGGRLADCPGHGFTMQAVALMANAVINLCLLVLPMPTVWKLHMARVTKFLIIIVFCVGGFAFAASVINLVVQLISRLGPSSDVESLFHDSSVLFYKWQTIEISVGLIACNLPVLSFRASRALSSRLKSRWTFLLGSVKMSSTRPKPNGPPRRNMDSNARCLGRNDVVVDWNGLFTTRKSRTRLEDSSEKGVTPESSTNTGLSSAGNEKGSTDIWGAGIPGITVPERAEANPTTRYQLEQTDSRSGMVDSQNGRVIGGFDAV